jgi:hypothetical protein
MDGCPDPFELPVDLQAQALHALREGEELIREQLAAHLLPERRIPIQEL